MADDEVAKQDESENNSEKEEYNSKLDFFSDEFDPLLALNTPGTSAPIPDAKRYDNLAAFKSAMDREQNPEKFQKRKQMVAEALTPVVRRWLPHQMPIPTQRKKRSTRNIFVKMANTVGPLSLLKRCVEGKLRIKVYTRNEEKARGYCLAYVVAFDKHFNMALEDVTEVWTRRKKKKIPALDSAESVKKFKFQRQFKLPEIKVTPHQTQKKLEVCTRHLDQVMLRGEHVALVIVVNQDKTDVKEDEIKDVKEENVKQ